MRFVCFEKQGWILTVHRSKTRIAKSSVRLFALERAVLVMIS